MNETTAPGLYLKLCKVMAQINRLPKTGYNKAQNYAFASESDLTDMIRPLLADQGVFLFSSMESVEQTPIESKNGAVGTHAKVTMTFTFIDAETGELRASAWTGEAMDYQDKSINKAATAALKYFLLKTFLISTGETDDDADSAAPEPVRRPPTNPARQTPPPPPAEVATRRVKALNLGAEVYGDEWPTKQVQLCNAVSFGNIASVDGLTLNELNQLISGMEKKLAELKATPPAQPTKQNEAA